jgi:hypothetical protein
VQLNWRPGDDSAFHTPDSLLFLIPATWVTCSQDTSPDCGFRRDVTT